MEIRINKDQVTHIKIYDSVKGAYLSSISGEGNTITFSLLPEKKISRWAKFWTGLDKLEEGYYRDGKYKFPERFKTTFISKDKVGRNKRYKNVDGELWENIEVEIYNSKTMMKRLWFSSMEEAKGFCSSNLPNVDLIF